MMKHLVFLHDEPLDEILAGRKKFEVRLSFGRLACASVREGDTLYLKRVGGAVEAACRAGEVRLHRGLKPEEVADLARRYADGSSASYFGSYGPQGNPDRPVNAAIIQLLEVRAASLPPEETPRRVFSGWVPHFRGGEDVRK